MPDTRTPRRTVSYVDPAALARLVRAHRRTRTVSEGLALALLEIARGVWERRRPTDDREDFAQACYVYLSGTPLRKADPKRNLFAYFATCASRYGFKLKNKAAEERRKFEGYARALADSGAEIPAAD